MSKKHSASNRDIGPVGHRQADRQRIGTPAAGVPAAPADGTAEVGIPEQLRFLAEASRDLNSSLVLADVFQKIARRVYRLVDCHLFCVMLWDEQTQALEHSYSLRLGEHITQEGSFPMGYGISGVAAEQRRPVRVGDVRQDPRYVRFRHAEVEIRSELAVPLICQDQLVGVLDLESMEADLFTEEHEQMLAALASQMATALENARLYEKMHAHEQQLQKDLETARQIQKGLLPDEAPRLPGLQVGTAFAPARELAGDFYDFLPYPSGQMAFAIGDVAGKATPAALYGAMAVGLLRGHVVQHGFTPAQMLAHVNEHLCQIQVDNRFLAMIFGLFDAADRSLIMAGAGFPWPRLIRAGKIEAIEVAGLPLGLFPGASYEEIRLELAPGDIIVLCSDGLEDCLYEQQMPEAEGFLDGWLQDLATGEAQEIADRIIRASDPAAAGLVEAADDRTVLVIKATS